MIKTADIHTALRRRYPRNSWALLFEVPDETGAGKRRAADALAMSLWPSRGLTIEGIEIKVSRSDWLRELKKPEKAESVAHHCNAWWIATAPGVIKDELPAGWGHLELNDRGELDVKLEAPIRHGEGPIDRRFVAAILRGADKAILADVETLLKPHKAQLEAAFETRLHSALADRLGARTKGEDLLAILGAQFSGSELARLGDEDIAKAVALVLKSGAASTWLGLDSIRDTLVGMATRIEDAQVALGLAPAPRRAGIPKRKRRS